MSNLLRRVCIGSSSSTRCVLLPARTNALLVRAFASSAGSNVSHIKNTPHLKRKLGQHLLVSEHILAQIVDAANIPSLLRDKNERTRSNSNDSDNRAASVDADAALHILEIGPGTGNLTSALLNTSPRVHVHAIEFDKRMVERLRERFYHESTRLTIEQNDFEDFVFATHAPTSVDRDDVDTNSDDASLAGTRKRTSGRAMRRRARWTRKPLDNTAAASQAPTPMERQHFDACVANIPYHLSSIIVSRLSSYMHKFPTHFRCAVLLVQEEFALRLLAKPGDQNYSRLSVNTALVADVTSIGRVGRSHFLPPPKVDSRVIHLTPRAPLDAASKSLVPTDDKLFFQRFDALLRVCFLRKNKTLRALLLSKTARAHLEKPLADEDANSDDRWTQAAQIEAALNVCDLSSRRAVQLPVDAFIRLLHALEERGVVFKPSTTRHFRD